MPFQGERVRQARELSRLTQTALAELIGVKQAAISQIESGVTTASPELGQAIAAATGFPEAFFHRDPGPDFPLGSLVFRARRATTIKDLRESHRWAELIYECSKALGERFEQRPTPIPRLQDATPEEAARVTRSALGLAPDRPIVNLTHTLENNNAYVLALPVKLDRRDAFSLWIDSAPSVPVIFLSAGVPGDRLRFSLSHELGHAVLHYSQRGQIRTVERQADAFASELLLPADAMKIEIVPPVTIESLGALKRRWGTSIQSLILRARDLRIISKRRTQHLFRLLARAGTGVVEPAEYDIPIEKPRTLRKMMEVVYGNPVDPRRVAADFDISAQLAAAIIGVHAERHELVPTVPHEEVLNIIPFSRRRQAGLEKP
jgi:Zn-dependent peptidase ImmA (M78 family)/DNA-binding XRE family transcriptional regulator